MVHHSQCCTLISRNNVCTPTALFVALKHHLCLSEYLNPFYFPRGFLLRIEYIPTRKMPLRTAAIRRCGFELPKNDRYQCQRAGDKFQPILNLWYCRNHDRHAQDRCQVLVEWAGKGAQCEQLGVLDENSRKKLCEWHLRQATGDTWLEQEDVGIEQRNDSVQECICYKGRWQDAAMTEDSVPDHPGQPLLIAHRSLNSLEEILGFGPSEQELPSEGHFSDARTFVSDGDADSKQSQEEDTAAVMIDSAALQEETVTNKVTLLATCPLDLDYQPSGTTTPTCEVEPNLAIEFGDGLGATTAKKETSTSEVASDVINTTEGGHCMVASPFEPSMNSSTSGYEGPQVSPPIVAAQDAAPGLGMSLQSPKPAFGTTPSRQSVHARISFLNAIQDQEVSTSNRIAAAYVQCCICLERHGEHHMREIVTCKHRYRNLCLRKATKTGRLRRFNCSSCRTWMEEQ
jgi:hypothetical protein